MRRLPIYIVLDTSYSMEGEPIVAVRNGLQSLMVALRQDPYALETAFVSIITFGGTAQQVVPLTEVAMFQEPTIETNGATPLGGALDVTLAGAENSPVVNPAFVIEGWGEAEVVVRIDGEPVPAGRKVRVGHRHHLDGCDLIVWIEHHAEKPVRIEIAEKE